MSPIKYSLWVENRIKVDKVKQVQCTVCKKWFLPEEL